MKRDDGKHTSDEQPEGPGYEAPQAEEVPSIEGPAVTSAGSTIT